MWQYLVLKYGNPLIMAYVLINMRYMICFLLILFSCVNDQKDTDEISILYPNNFKVKKGSEIKFYIVISNDSDRSMKIDNINTSCKCIILDKKHPLELSSLEKDSIEVKLEADKIGLHKEKIIIAHSLESRFKKESINYEVYK